MNCTFGELCENTYGKSPDEMMRRVFAHFGDSVFAEEKDGYINVRFKKEGLPKLLSEIENCEKIEENKDFLTEYLKNRLEYLCETVKGKGENEEIRRKILIHYYGFEKSENVITGEKRSISPEARKNARKRLAKAFYIYDRTTTEDNTDYEAAMAVRKIIYTPEA